MGLYNVLFGMNAASDLLLSFLGLTQDDVGRFRDCYIKKNAKGIPEIHVYTRNGGGNRDCWHEDRDWGGYKECKNESRIAVVDECIWATEEEAKQHPEWKGGISYCGNKRTYWTGKKVDQKQYQCLNPTSQDCCCPGCIINYRLPKHPNYLGDKDDDYDCTYATIRFSVPEKFLEAANILASESPDPATKWRDLLDKLQSKDPNDPEVKRVMQVMTPVIENITEALR